VKSINKLMIVALLTTASLFMMGAYPTVTTTKLTTPLSTYVLNYSFSAAIATADTAILASEATSSTHIDISSYGYVDSVFSLELKSSEATVDSIRFTVLVQASSAASPAGADWHTVFSSSAFDSGATKIHIPFRIRRYTQAHKMRILIAETTTGHTKNATQTITARLAIRRLLK